MNSTVKWFFMALHIRGLLPNEDMVKSYEEAKEMELERLKEAYSMGRMNKSIKEFNEKFNQQ
jgi:hypothetical protein